MTWPLVGRPVPVIALRCVCADGERVTVLVENGEPFMHLDRTGPDVVEGDKSSTPYSYRVVRRDGTVVLKNVVSFVFGREVVKSCDHLGAYVLGTETQSPRCSRCGASLRDSGITMLATDLGLLIVPGAP